MERLISAGWGTNNCWARFLWGLITAAVWMLALFTRAHIQPLSRVCTMMWSPSVCRNYASLVNCWMPCCEYWSVYCKQSAIFSSFRRLWILNTQIFYTPSSKWFEDWRIPTTSLEWFTCDLDIYTVSEQRRSTESLVYCWFFEVLLVLVRKFHCCKWRSLASR